MDRLKPLLVAGFGLVFLYGAWQWDAGFRGGRAERGGAIAVASTLPPAGAPELDAALGRMRGGLSYLRQAAKTGMPEALQEAERDVLGPLLDALAAVRVDGRGDPARYERVAEAVSEAQGLFKEIPYALEVEPGGDLPALKLALRRPALPAIQARTAPLGWQVSTEGDGVVLRP